MSTDIIFSKLKTKAEDALRTELELAASNYNRALSLAGTCAEITLRDKQGITIKVYTSDIYKAITETLYEKRKDVRTNEEVQTFLKSVATLSSQFKLLEELNLDE